MKKLIVTIDGPAGAGKTTVSRKLADRLGYRYIDTGALYRGVAYEANHLGISSEDDESLKRLCRDLKLNLTRSKDGLRLIANGVDITNRIRTPEITMLASAVSARAPVRDYLLGLQRELGKEKCAVFEGRDMGTVVFPDADIKFFLIASQKTRVLRRYNELKLKENMTIEKVEKDLSRRDANDSNRDLAPLKAAADAVVIDSTDLNADGVVSAMMAHIEDA
jgi:cytidylate kinase